ncbi:MAG: radical SAM protein [Roseburia sp.]|nr:radical SAM protein [Roseburia sp.]
MAEITPRSLKKNRTVLHEVVPVDTPFLLGIFLGDLCNFKCKYCIQSADDSTPEKQQLTKKFLEWETFVKIADSAKKFPNKIKTVLLSSIGEPLLHPQIVEMIQYMKQIDLADAYEIVTNASMLTPELGKGLVDAGLTRLCISLQGLTAQKYVDISGVDIDYQQFYENIKTFYQYSRGKCKLHIKTVDVSLDEGEDQKFMEMYGPICDTIFIDTVAPVFKGVDYTEIVQNEEAYRKEAYEKNRGVCCGSLFYTLYTLADGRIAPCCDHPQPMIYGDIKEMGLVEAWNSQRRRDFLVQHLTHKRCDNSICAGCAAPLVREFEEDMLDGYEEMILEKVLGGDKN